MELCELGGWGPLLEEVCAGEDFQRRMAQVEEAYAQGEPEVYPPRAKLFRALALTPPEAVRVVILGQDPYPTRGHAQGLAFSVEPGTVPLPRSLRNIFRELKEDVGVEPPVDTGDLTVWAERGVLLLNTTLTVYQGAAGSHSKWGWDDFTARVLAITRALPQPVAYLLWGAHAQKMAERAGISIESPGVFHSAHPSPLSARRGFFGSRPFSGVNAFLTKRGQRELDWSL